MDGISDARAYTPRGRTVRDTPELRRAPRGGRSADPFRPALQVLEGGRSASTRGGRRDDRTDPGSGGGGRRAGAGSQRSGATSGTARATTGGPRTNSETRTSTGSARSTGAVRAGRVPTQPVRGGARTGSPPPRRRPTTGQSTGGLRRGGSGRAARPVVRRPVRKKRFGPPRLAEPTRRLRIGSLLVLALFAVIGIRLVALQVVDAPAYAGGGVADRTRTVELPAPRGAIYDRAGVALAHSVEARYVYADPVKIQDLAGTAAALSPLLGIPRSELVERMRPRVHPDGRLSMFEYLARQVDIETADRVMALNLAGIGVKPDERREVPGGDLAANLLGFIGEDRTGLEGLEARYDELLRGVNGRHVYEFNRGDGITPIPGGYSRLTEAQPGSSLGLTIDRDLQYEVQRVLSRTMQEVNGTTGAAVVLDLNGEILAQASHPTYNAADWRKSDPADRQDAATSFVVDPGSVHKPIIFGAGLEEGVIKPDSAFRVPSTIRKGDTVFSDTHPLNGRTATLAGMLGYSSNVGTIRIADVLGPQRVHDYQVKFGLGAATGAGVPGEAAGRVLDPADWSGSSHGSVPIGHSVDVTPLQMAAVYAAIANDGVWVQPHLVRETVAPDGTRTPAPDPQTRQVISAENAAALRELMEAVVALPDGTGTNAAIAGYRVAGKTGTGRRIVDGRYTNDEVASFIGMAPADQPRYVIAVFVHTPGGGGGTVAAPAFRDMMAFTLRHFRVPPTGSRPPDITVFPG
ncbi:penicillin-binding protein 2 [Solwaraspora sp. WMMD1047]|uniref:peptidoglycan D,D-transpeptidase FtsI family protein n=1 Tax=Solwaraspora sp. WMMD1047 TaxID=3016102 RepID=UPI0024165BB7|nr:penicillin-binding protein 2 [Solwaraspora sp. WMMD1047]MDG4832148.1 penicillin-binding protein 2 [Solwaraspora sp. WMMD1047]